jgi:hypothetical protein
VGSGDTHIFSVVGGVWVPPTHYPLNTHDFSGSNVWFKNNLLNGKFDAFLKIFKISI